ncbi:hypothetical protein ENBRE01_2070 [Enteropsectra breve]|nr:hypothetical protein ENBRE01_2070 [Enteropsectra breve]
MKSPVKNEVKNHRLKYEKKIIKKRTWKTIAGAGLKIGSLVLLKKDFDANSATKQKPFDVISDGKHYRIIAISENGLIDIQDLNDETNTLKNVTLDRICPIKE